MRALFCLILVSLVATSSLQAQSSAETPLHNAGYFGYSVYMPNFRPKGYEALGPWQGAELNVGLLSFGYYEGSLRGIGADSTVASTNGNLYRIGGRFGKRFELGKTSFTSVAVEPFMKITGSLAQIPNKLVDSHVGSSGLVFSPGVMVKFSHLYLTAAYDAGLYAVTTPSRVNRQYAVARGYLGGYTITVGLDNAFDILMPEAFTFKGLNIYKRTYTEQEVKYDWSKDQYFLETTTTTYTKYTPGKRSLSLMSPFWGIGPSYSFRARQERQAATTMMGVNAGLRIWYAMLDGFYEAGKLGLADQVGKDPILINYPVLRNYDFSSQVAARKYGVRAGFNLSKFFATKVNFEQESKTKRKVEFAVPYFRVHGFGTIGKVDFLSAPEYTFSGASERLLDLQNKLEITPEASNNPDFLPASTTFTGLGINVEIGSVFFNTTWYQYQDAAIANHRHHTVGGNIPLMRVANSLRARWML